MMDPAHASDATQDAPVVFRGKKRKFLRQRPADEDVSSVQADAANDPAVNRDGAAQNAMAKEVEDNPSVAEIIRRRNARKSRMKGVGFGADVAQSSTATADDELTLMIREEEQKATELANGGVNKRFTAQTGLSSDLVNKHMTEFIESELAKRKSAASSSHGTSQGPSSECATASIPMEARHDLPIPTFVRGQLQEVDLGDDVRSKNEILTERARRKLQGEVVDEEQSSRPKKVRLGRDGKPWRTRNRRTSDDIKRDQLVDEILRENRLDVYETPTPPAATTPGVDHDEAADDRLAEEFRREFLEAMAERQQKKKPVPAAKKDEEVLKGPKLGGSRNARAAMRDLMLKKEKEQQARR
ncbi:hypothetical protein BKA67DRAFT_575027 [Truncatella angustata]|uniref:Uncharacterized protein n=1 Tax=Truncatella angustata TaxID=152316 RepID=A0A9P8UEK6_9PEZI|nr:uncharacterized protein BKA67DRAFT_575027 [Truncatella angustata]KAH6648511.1 hypothetical protein BKA67DRAFT_575027 [Truncatella angustata]KAH8195249.1 hypothetical protein TruAng_010573 [Truncatella angustata]